ncbi:hypothetical protein ABT154_19960 [Streptomyces sp. NPDC001728]
MPVQNEAFLSVRISEAILPKVENPGSSSPASHCLQRDVDQIRWAVSG